MPFLHFKAHEFCIDILFYDFCTKSIEISWYCKLVMPIVSNLSSSHPSLCLLMFEHLYIPKTFNKYSAWDVFDSKIINTIHNFFVVWTTSTMMWVLWLSKSSQDYRVHGFISNPCKKNYFINLYYLNTNVMHYLNTKVVCTTFMCK